MKIFLFIKIVVKTTHSHKCVTCKFQYIENYQHINLDCCKKRFLVQITKQEFYLIKGCSRNSKRANLKNKNYTFNNCKYFSM